MYCHPQPFEVLEKLKQIKHLNIWLRILKQNDHHLTKNKKQQHLYYCIVLLKQIIIIFISNTDFWTYLLTIRNPLSEHMIPPPFFYNPKWEWEFFQITDSLPNIRIHQKYRRNHFGHSFQKVLKKLPQKLLWKKFPFPWTSECVCHSGYV